MKGVQLSPTIDYLSMEDEQGPVGVLVFRGTMHQPAMVASVENQDDFKGYKDRYDVSFENRGMFTKICRYIKS